LIRRRTRSLLASLAACALAFAATPAPAAAAPADPAPLLLRLPDLGPGYVVSFADRSCGVLKPSTSGSLLRRALGSRSFRGCSLSFYRAWSAPGRAPGPMGVQTFAVTFDTPTAAMTALSRSRALPHLLFRRSRLRVVEPAPSIGDQAVLMRVDKTLPFLGLHVSAGIVIWRSGSALGMVTTINLAAGDAAARAVGPLAALQQARIANPTPLLPPVNDDRLVPLDDPTLGMPVMWLGARLPAHGHLPALNLRDSEGSPLGGQPLVQISYGAPHRPATANVELWRPRALRRELAVPPRRHHCRRRFQARVPGARSWIRATYVREDGRCPRERPSYAGVAFFGGVGVKINVTRSRRDPYDSRVGLRRLLRTLRPRLATPSPAG
jgi:hypothetical protein